MKLKYFLRGLGVGILFSAIVLALSFYNKPKENLTEEEILERAEKYGLMTEEEWKNRQMEKALENMGNQEASPDAIAADGVSPDAIDSASNGESTDSKDTSDSGSFTDSKDDSDSESPAASREPADSEKPSESKKPSESEKPSATKKPDSEKTPPPSMLAEIVVKSGMVSSEVAEDLERQGIVKDAYDFDDYMCSNGFAPQIQSGTFYVPKGASYLEIAQILMGR